MRRPSLRNRLLVILLGIFMLTWLGIMILTFLNTRHEIEEVFDARMADSVEVLFDLTEHVYEVASLHMYHEDTLEKGPLHAYQINLIFQVWRDGNLLLRSENTPDEVLTTKEGYGDLDLNDQTWRILSHRYATDKLYIIVGEQYAVRNKMIFSIATNVFWPTMFALPALALLILFGVQHGLIPLNRLSFEIGARSPTQLSPVSTAGLPREIIPMISSLNILLQRLEYALHNERRFTSDAAHELRTPLAALKAQAQVAARSNNKNERMNAIEQIIRGTDRLGRLVEQLLTLARLDPEDAFKHLTRVDLEKIIESVSSELAIDALKKKIQFELIRKGLCVINGQATALSVLVRNLIDNAIRYTPQESQVTVSIRAENDQVIFSVRDTGTGIPENQRQRIFDRFYRILGNSADGSGLGLSIVKRIADMHNATMEIVTPEDGQGVEFRVLFPALID
jgi:two-component system sensor histidine kinase QseC